ncbi:Hypothetical_protein [Hexamita inflata]|uniref:Hypothetical_protein n=1 Tax=Hexamita inflata TaxID=28002 RepID=A0AA86QD40_9EUKA|nr:Hypothetical protein HINF_LOCUS37480 [Hexamita inflata]CAI9974548.1 Hypothetical protein HINF_LOCUS62193 [Hexamita inflata]
MNYNQIQMQLKLIHKQQTQYCLVLANVAAFNYSNFVQLNCYRHSSAQNQVYKFNQANPTFHSQLTSAFSCRDIDSAIIKLMISVSEDVSVDYELNLLEGELTDFECVLSDDLE